MNTMGTFTVCSQCLRALRRSIRQEAGQLTSGASAARRQQQYLSTTSAGRARAAPQTATTTREQPVSQVTPPTTASTVTSNVTATPPSDEASAQQTPRGPSIPDGLSVSEMQKQIQGSLNRPDMVTRLAQGLRKTAKATTQTYITYGQTDILFKSCAKQADYFIPEDQRMQILTGKTPPKAADGADLGQPVGEPSWWFNTLDLPPTFSTWSGVTFLHMYLLTVRLRDIQDAAAFQSYHRYLIEHFSQQAEEKMIIQHNMTARGVRNKYLKDLFLQWRGNILAYDEGLLKGDAVLGAAVWRNLFRGQEDVDWEKVALVVGFMRRVISKLGLMRVHDILHGMDGPNGHWALAQKDAEALVARDSKGITEPFEN
ncbi:Serine carboxypeptidase 3 [Exophiala dermatitidis]|uniref:Ubiquinol-cytochrome c chaperone domain-containing protein n=2 Tax=Exophiala dermatitidis TaxID=5970 RepID=H6C718_EXODN|nr:uncharacterized protein HMPREF1120_07501 [Exophiala dermatitidis NIH/UT8656]KAJ4526021.1 Serine carboxypeptidase 3 [Exophiala dermatitidis]EHY59513.1 hypothetical protein HMPREF1120_07501 [Exophiala dermatitidis NIH/UT8656]KAJ4527033.1 Serine carboxypeptidase 3 [Exophiala dermatitidis]KAJ4532749.1 Serine carboxypeptidase 3 [Exophiala dermatitidis]KAJ4546738.1 Serine carboxypeptidase 3 [Exophiala dermatitidis]